MLPRAGFWCFLRLFGLVFIAFLGKSVFTELLFFVLTMLRFSLKRHNKSVPGNEIIALAQSDNDTTCLRPRGSFGARVPRQCEIVARCDDEVVFMNDFFIISRAE